MRRLIRSVPHRAAADLFGLFERALVPHAAELPRPGAATRILPPGFLAFAVAGLLCIVAAAAHERVRDGETSVAPRTSLRARKIAYASWNRMAVP
jgi:hypothetical protein